MSARYGPGSIWLALLLSCSAASPVRAQEPDVPADLQISLLTRILAFDRGLAGREGRELVIGIVYQPEYPASRDFERDITAASAAAGAGSSRIATRVVSVELDQPARLGAALRRAGVDVALIAPLRAVDIGSIVAAARAADARTVGGVAEYVEQGCALGFAVARGKPRIRIHLERARAEGSDFAAELLSVSEIVR